LERTWNKEERRHFEYCSGTYVERLRKTVSMLPMSGNGFESGSSQIRSRNASIWVMEFFPKELLGMFCSVSKRH
jgi:hypothetical protein